MMHLSSYLFYYVKLSTSLRQEKHLKNSLSLISYTALPPPLTRNVTLVWYFNFTEKNFGTDVVTKAGKSIIKYK